MANSIHEFSESKPKITDPPGFNGPSNYGERLAKIETRMEYLATKEDVEKALSAQLKWQLGILVVAALAPVVAGATLALRLIDIATAS